MKNEKWSTLETGYGLILCLPEKTNKAGIFFFAYSSAGFFLIYGLYTQVAKGHITTGMRDNVVWGMYIVNFIFFMGISYAGALISGVLHLFKSDWRGPVIRMAELTTIISLLIGPSFILFCIGRLDRLPYLVMYPRIQSPITWDVIAISTDIIGCVIFLYLSFIEDFARLRDKHNKNFAAWRRKTYRVLSLGYTGTPEQKKHLKWARDVVAAMIIAIAIIVYSVLAWIFGVTLQPGWHSTISGPTRYCCRISGNRNTDSLRLYRKYILEDFITKPLFILRRCLLILHFTDFYSQ